MLFLNNVKIKLFHCHCHCHSSSVFRFRASLQFDSILIKAVTTLGLLATMATHPALRRCTPEPWPYYKVSMSCVCSQCHKSWGELFVQFLFWLGTFKVFWYSNTAEYRRIKGCVCTSPPTLPLPPSIPTQAVDGDLPTIMKFNANGIDNKLAELGEFLK